MSKRAFKEVYLGDGLYARDENYAFWLRAPRSGVDHEVALEGQVLDEFLRFIERSRGVKITVTPLPRCHECGEPKEILVAVAGGAICRECAERSE